MIEGKVVDAQARIQIKIPGQRGRDETIEAIVDTGFDGWLTLPPILIDGLGLQWHSEGRGILADGTESWFNVYEARIRWHGRLRRIFVVSGNTVPLVGMELLSGNELNIKVRPSGKVTIKPMRSRR